MLHGKIALNSVLLLLLMTFVSGLRFELIYISLIVSIKPHSSPCFSAACAAAIVYRNHFFSFVPINQNKSSDSKVKFRQSSNRCKKVLEAAKIADAMLLKLHMLLKYKSPSLLRNLALGTFCEYQNSVLNKSESAIPPLFNRLGVLSSASDKAKLFAKNFSKNSNLDDTGISLPVFPSRTNLKLRNVPITSKMVEKVITNLDS